MTLMFVFIFGDSGAGELYESIGPISSNLVHRIVQQSMFKLCGFLEATRSAFDLGKVSGCLRNITKLFDHEHEHAIL